MLMSAARRMRGALLRFYKKVFCDRLVWFLLFVFVLFAALAAALFELQVRAAV